MVRSRRCGTKKAKGLIMGIHLKTDPSECYMENEFKSRKVRTEAKKTIAAVQVRYTGSLALGHNCSQRAPIKV